MKTTFLLIVFLTSTFYLFAQDVIIKTNGDNLNCKITKIDSTDVYFTFDSNGRTFSTNLKKSQIQNIDKLVAKFNAEISQKKEGKKYSFGIYADPLGFLQFGPFLGTEITLNKVILDVHARFSSLGLLMPVISANDNGEQPGISGGSGIGIDFKYYTHRKSGGFYVGPMFEFGGHTETFSDHVEDISYIVFAANAGYKFSFRSGFFIKTGAYLGFATVTSDDIVSGSATATGEGKVHPFGCFELGFGVDF